MLHREKNYDLINCNIQNRISLGIFNLWNACAVRVRMFRTRGLRDIQYCVWEILSVHWRVFSTSGDIISTVGEMIITLPGVKGDIVSSVEDIHSCGGKPSASLRDAISSSEGYQ